MNKLVLQRDSSKYQNEPNVSIEHIEDKFHGKLTIHFAHGIPKKVEINNVKDIIALS